MQRFLDGSGELRKTCSGLCDKHSYFEYPRGDDPCLICQMLEALKAIVDAFGVGQSDEAFLRQMNDALIPDAQKAISKAEGR